MALTPLHVQDYCYGAPNSKNGNYIWSVGCKYLTHEWDGRNSLALCMKKAPGILEKKFKQGQLPLDWNKQPDNCNGYRYMKHIDQGYDVPNSS